MCRQHAIAHAPRAHLHAQRQGIDEHPQRAVGALAPLHPAHQYGAEHHVFATRYPTQHQGPGQVMQTGRAHAQPTGLAAQTTAQIDGDLSPGLLDIAAVATDILQPEWQGRFVDGTQHVVEERFVFFTAHTQAGLGHIVAIRHRCAQLVSLAQQVCLHFVAHHFQCCVIERHMVKQQGRDPALVACILGKTDAHQRRLADIQVLPGVQLNSNVAVLIPQQHLLDAQRCLAPDHLHRLVQPFPGHGRAQDVVAIDHALQGLGEIVQACAVVEGELRLQHVGVALFGRQVVIENPLLQRRQRVDVLHIGRPARHGRDDAVDGVLGQPHQRQHVGGNALAVRRNQVGRNFHLVAGIVADSRCQRSQGRLAEQHAHVGTQAGLTHPLDQADGQQRVAAEFEEVVVTPHLLQTQQVLPDLRQGGFSFTLWSFVATTDDRIQVRRRQGLAVELAVGGQRHGVEAYIGHGHHVFRQLRLQMTAQGFDVRCFVRRREIGHQALVTRYILAGQHYGFLDVRMSGEPGFDLAQFDAETTDLHLVVVTAEVFDIAVRQVAAQVAGLVHPGIRFAAERILEEAFGGQVIAVEITTGDTGTTDVDFPRYAQWHRLFMFVQQIELGVRHWFADVRSKAVLAGHGDPTGISRGFRRTIEVAQAFD
ncbi:hypothetical protein SRABI112_01674 [Pseudomonas mediterranea]|nr:hypothetical protein SRABI112_01674 [Pseudomonas mediterranea]